ncbi:hypothetical protein B0H66DRAFT_32866 [Apodospora peruviana]|uniref:Uncharacterized protein n=1 Tax=Apodospora peruviana TaxID=516989 RepID=A0AAE0IR58_9PEZI|nr:hypothetical protein B0H66DRAFT_32866 [Apodospora peruviana]
MPHRPPAFHVAVPHLLLNAHIPVVRRIVRSSVISFVVTVVGEVQFQLVLFAVVLLRSRPIPSLGKALAAFRGFVHVSAPLRSSRHALWWSWKLRSKPVLNNQQLSVLSYIDTVPHEATHLSPVSDPTLSWIPLWVGPPTSSTNEGPDPRLCPARPMPGSSVITQHSGARRAPDLSDVPQPLHPLPSSCLSGIPITSQLRARLC